MKKLFFGAVAISFILSSCNDGPMDLAIQDASSDRTAETVNVSEMDKIIATMFDGTPQSRSNSLSNYTVNVINDSKNTPAIYVVNLDKGGYVLISATKKYNPVLAFSPEGKFNLDADTPEPLKLWVENTAEYASGNAEVCPDSLARYAKIWKGFECNSSNKLPISRNIKSFGGISYEESVKLREHIANYETEWSKKGYNYRCVENFTDWNIDDGQNKYKQLVEPHIYPCYIYDYYYLTYNVHYSETQVYD